jgi:small basic protein (TIGR04137 family)
VVHVIRVSGTPNGIPIFQEAQTMSQHPSLKSASKIRIKRNVLKRFERIDLLRERGKWQEGDRALGLPKTKPE